MSDNQQQEKRLNVGSILAILLGSPWLEIVAEVWKIGKKIWRGYSEEGMYEVLEHEVSLELLDRKGKKAKMFKRQKVRYLQNNIIAYQDQGWGDGEIFVNYQCSPGVEVDRYKAGHKIYVLISLQEVKKRNDVSEFHISWEHLNGYTRQKEQWGTEISHRTKRLKLSVIFPKSRLPSRVLIEEYLRKRSTLLSQEAIHKLPDGRLKVTWEKINPKLHEHYNIKWEW